MWPKPKNTIEKGTLRYVIFQEDDTWFGVALELNLVVEGDDPSTAFSNLQEAVNGYLHSTRIASLRPTVLNQKPSSEYLNLWKDLEAGRKPTLARIDDRDAGSEPAPIVVNTYGFFPHLA